MTPEDRRAAEGGLIDPSTTAPDLWAADEIRESARRVDELSREIGALESSLKTQHDEIAQLAEALQTVEGRTLRHEAGQDAAREVRHEIAQLDERIEAEVSLRRELAAAVGRAQQREHELRQELQRALGVIAERLEQFDGRQASTVERQRTMLQEIAGHEREDLDVDGRLDRLERQVEALREADRHAGTEVARVASALPGLLSTLEAVEARARTIQADQRRIDEDVAALRAVRDREADLLEVLDQQRATRARLDDRVSRVEETLEELLRQDSSETEALTLLQRQVAGEAEQRRALAERLEAQHDAVLEHLRRLAAFEEERGGRQIKEIERDVRIARNLLVRLQEQSGEAQQEQPL